MASASVAVAYLFLVRSMRLQFVAALLLSGCSSVIYHAGPLVTGPHASTVSQADVQEIADLVRSRRDIRRPIYKISVEAPYRAVVNSGSDSFIGAQFSEFTVVKYQGRWRIASRVVQGGVAEVERIIRTE